MKPHRCLWQIKHCWMCHAICGGKQQLVARREAKAARLCDCSLEGAVISVLNDSDYGHYDKCVSPRSTAKASHHQLPDSSSQRSVVCADMVFTSRSRERPWLYSQRRLRLRQIMDPVQSRRDFLRVEFPLPVPTRKPIAGCRRIGHLVCGEECG